MPSNHVSGLVYLSTKNIWEPQGTLVCLQEVLRDGHLSSVTKRECKVVCTSAAQSLDDPRPRSVHQPSVRVPGEDTYSCDEALEFDSLAIRETSARGQCVRITMRDELPAEFEQVSCLVHNTGGDVDVDEHTADRRANRLEISAPKYKTISDVLGFFVGEERTDVESIVGVQGRLHPDDDVLR